MTELILKKDIGESKMKALLAFLKSWGIDVEVRQTTKSELKENTFSLNVGMWKDYNIDAKTLREQSWKLK